MNSLNVMKKKKCIAVISIINEWIQLLYTTYIHAKNYYTNTYIHIRHNIGKKYEKKKYRKLFQIQGPLPRKLILLLIVKCWLLHDFTFVILEPVQILEDTVMIYLYQIDLINQIVKNYFEI